jgi:hypothetical protein
VNPLKLKHMIPQQRPALAIRNIGIFWLLIRNITAEKIAVAAKGKKNWRVSMYPKLRAYMVVAASPTPAMNKRK